MIITKIFNEGFKKKYLQENLPNSIFDRIDLSRNLNTPPNVLDKLADDKDNHVREKVAHNPRTSSQTLDRLANDSSGYIRWTVAQNPNTSPDTLLKLANDPDE